MSKICFIPFAGYHEVRPDGRLMQLDKTDPKVAAAKAAGTIEHRQPWQKKAAPAAFAAPAPKAPESAVNFKERFDTLDTLGKEILAGVKVLDQVPKDFDTLLKKLANGKPAQPVPAAAAPAVAAPEPVAPKPSATTASPLPQKAKWGKRIGLLASGAICAAIALFVLASLFGNSSKDKPAEVARQEQPAVAQPAAPATQLKPIGKEPMAKREETQSATVSLPKPEVEKQNRVAAVPPVKQKIAQDSRCNLTGTFFVDEVGGCVFPPKR